MSPVDLSKQLRAYELQWVAMEKGTHKVVAHGKKLIEVKAEAIRKGFEHATFAFVPAFDAYFAS